MSHFLIKDEVRGQLLLRDGTKSFGSRSRAERTRTIEILNMGVEVAAIERTNHTLAAESLTARISRST